MKAHFRYFLLLFLSLIIVVFSKHFSFAVQAYANVSAKSETTYREKEYIKNYKSTIEIEPNSANLIVTEDITVNIAHQNIKHGIYRDFPLYYKTTDTHESYRIEFQLLEAKLDQKPVSYHIKDIKNGIRIYLGESDTLAPVGLHTYTIKYKVSNEMRYFDDHDELYWNVTGNDWLFRIYSAEAVVKLPNSVKLNPQNIKYTAYTGSYGESKKAYTARILNNAVIFKTTKPLDIGEGFTIVVGFPKGIIKEPTKTQKFLNRLKYNSHIIIAVLGGVVFVSLFYKYWRSYGKDPELGSIMPIFNIPHNLDPAVIRAINKDSYSKVDNKSISSMLVYLAVKGFIRIKQLSKKKFRLELIKRPKDKSTLEYKLLDALFKRNSKITLSANSYDYVVAKRLIDFKNKLSLHVNKNLKNIWKGNEVYIFKLALLAGSVVLLTLGVAVSNCVLTQDTAVSIAIAYLFVTLGLFSFYYVAYNKKAKYWLVYWGIYTLLLFIFNAFLIKELSVFVYFVFNVIASILAISVPLLPRYTEEGIKIKREVLGFKEYLETAEQDRLNYLNPPELTVQLFEKYLPYAMALDVAHKWAKKFTKVFKNMTQNNERTDYVPLWYIGYNNNLQLDNLTKTLDNTLSNVVTSAGTFSSSGGGSGFSGGFSGGGGGGGGGGGW